MGKRKSFYYTYMLKCQDGSYYVGVTHDVWKRLNQHQLGNNTNAYTYFRRPVELVYYATFQNPYDAISWEKKIKRWSRKKKEALIEANWDEIKRLAECQNESHSRNVVSNKNN